MGLIIRGSKRYREIQLQENINIKDNIIRELQKIRHEYNNMLQSFIGFIEAEDMETLKEYKAVVLEKTAELNTNSFTQLTKINNTSILGIIYELLIKGKNAEVNIKLTINNIIEEIDSLSAGFYEVLYNYINNAYSSAIQHSTYIKLKIISSDKGIRFVFENTVDYRIDKNTLTMEKNTRKHKFASNIFFNTFICENNMVQEIIISTTG